MKKLLLTSFLLLIISNIAFTQNMNKPFSVSGKIVDKADQQPIEFVSVAIYKLPDSILVTGVMTNEQGLFEINNLGKGKFFLKASFVGYQTSIKEVQIAGASVKLSQPLAMTASSTALGEVTVEATQKERQSSVEKTKINVARNIAAVSGNILDVLKGQSSITVDNNEGVYIRGNKNTLILMDGVPTSLSSLSSIPASNVESLEIITTPDARYDAEGTGGIINIVTKRQKGDSGLSGNVVLNYGFNNRLNGGVRLRYNTGIWSFDAGYNGKYEKSNVESSLTRQLYSENVLVDQHMHSKQTNTAHTATLSATAQPNKKETYTVGLKAVLPDFHNVQTINGIRSENTSGVDTENPFNRRNDAWHTRRMFETTFSYRNMFEKDKNELSVDASFSKNRGRRPAEYYIEDILLQKSSGGGNPYNASLQADYVKAIGKGRMEVGLKGMKRYNDFDYKFYDLVGSDWVLNPRFTSDLEYNEYIYGAYLMYGSKLSKRTSYKLGARLEYNTSELIQKTINDRVYNTYWFSFPFLQVKHNLSEEQSLAFSFNRRITRPTYPQINPFINIIDETTYETGNKNIRPETIDKAELSYAILKDKYQLRTNAYFSRTNDFITQVSMLADHDQLMLTYVNGNRQNKIGADVDLTYKFNKFISVVPAFSVFHSDYKGQYNEIDLSANDVAWTGNMKILITPDKLTEVQLFGSFSSPISLPQFDLDKIYYADIAVKRTLLKNKLSASLTLTDVFNTREWKIKSDNKIYRLNNYSKNDTRILWLGLTFNFNSFKAGGKPQKETAGEDNGSIIKLGN